MPEETAEVKPAYLPPWLTKDYLQDKLRKCYNEPKLIVKDLLIKPASAQGDNYASVMLRLNLSFISGKPNENLQQESLIVKTTFAGTSLPAKIMNSYGIYEREMKMYDEVLPQQGALLASIQDNDQIFAETIYVDYDYSSIIFKDLTKSDFTMADRIGRLDITHAKLALRKLAKLHATAAVLHERKPEIFAENFDRGIFNRHSQGFKPMVHGILAALTRHVKQNLQLKDKYYEKLIALQPRIMEYCERAFDVNTKDFMTLAHGDYWHTNMMFKYADGTNKVPIDVIPLDYQFSAWASPTVDLLYFFNTSLQEDLRSHHQPELFQYYHEILTNTLKALKFKAPIPSLFDLRMQMEMRGFFGLFAALIFQPIMINPDTEDAEFINLISDTETGIRFKDTLFKNPVVQKYIVHLLPMYDKMGFFDNMDSVRSE